MNKILLSIIIPIYNVEKYLSSCLDSILTQDLNHVEIILVDDGSTDNSGKIADEYQKLDQHITVIHQINQGLSGARNSGIKISQGEWLAFVDSDDIIAPNYISSIINSIEKYNPDALIFQFKRFNNTETINSKVSEVSWNSISKKEAFITLGNDDYACYSWNKICRKDCYKNILFPINKNFEDMATSYRVFNNANTFYLTSSKLYFYRQREDSIVYTYSFKNQEDRVDGLANMYIFLQEKYPDTDMVIKNNALVEGMHYIYDAEKYGQVVNKNTMLKVESILKQAKISKSYLSGRFLLELIMFQKCKPIYNMMRKLTKKIHKNKEK